MRKVFIYLASFCVSFFIIYSIYYYSKVKTLQTGLVKDAANMPHTRLQYNFKGGDSTQNILYSPAIPQAMGLQDSGKIPHNHFVGAKGQYSQAMMEKIVEGLLHYFPNYPPIGYPDLKAGDSLLFAYFFQQAFMPKSFFWLSQPQKFAGKYVRTLIYRSDRVRDSNSYIQYWPGKYYRLTVLLNDSVNAFYVYDGAEKYFKDILQKGQPLPSGSRIVRLDTGQALVLPDIDFYIQKDYSLEAIRQDSVISHGIIKAEERLKVKTTVLNRNPVDYYGDLIFTHGSILFGFESRKSQKPYFVMLLRNAEPLVKVRHRR